MHMAFSDIGIALLLFASMGACFALLSILHRRRDARHRKRSDLAASLGLAYEKRPRGPSDAPIAWRISGTAGGRQVRLEGHRKKRASPDAVTFPVTRLSVNCALRHDFSVVAVVLTTAEHLESEQERVHEFPHPFEDNMKVAVKVQGRFDPEILPRTGLFQIMAAKGLTATLRIGDNAIKLSYDFGTESRNLDRPFIESAINAMVGAAARIEKNQ